VIFAGSQLTKMLEVHLYACGNPKLSMGWYHARQILDGRFEGVRLAHVLEPFILTSPVRSPEFDEWKIYAEAQGVVFHKTLDTAPAPSTSSMALICGRTSENPKFFESVVSRGFKHVMLEKPGAATFSELNQMAQLAKARDVKVYMGYNRNFSAYVKDLVVRAKDIIKQGKPLTLTLGRKDIFNEDGLDECFERNAEGMLANMLCHELMVLVTYFGLSTTTIKTITLHEGACKAEVRRGCKDYRK